MTIVTLIAANMAIWAVLCRIAFMVSGRTRGVVVFQHAVLALSLFVAGMTALDWRLLRAYGAEGWVVDLMAQPRIGVAVLSVGVMVYLLAGSARWRHGAPEGTLKPGQQVHQQRVPSRVRLAGR